MPTLLLSKGDFRDSFMSQYNIFQYLLKLSGLCSSGLHPEHMNAVEWSFNVFLMYFTLNINKIV